jgi:hypothetical protein
MYVGREREGETLTRELMTIEEILKDIVHQGGI